MEEFDERQQTIRGRIAVNVIKFMIIVMMVTAAIDSFGIYDISENIGVADLMIAMTCLMLTVISCPMILKDAYFGILSGNQMHICLYVFTVLCAGELLLFTYDVIRGEGISFVSFFSILMVGSISICLWLKKKDWD